MLYYTHALCRAGTTRHSDIAAGHKYVVEYSYCSCLLTSFKAFLSLVPRPPLFLPSVCVHNNTRQWRTRFLLVFCSRVLLWTQMEGKYGAGWRTRLGFPYPLLQAIKTWKEERPGNEAGCFIVFGTFYFFIFFYVYSDVGPIGDWCCFFFFSKQQIDDFTMVG